MPNKASSIKRVRQNERRRLHNRSARGEMRTSVKKAETAIVEGKVEEMTSAVRDAQSKLSRAAKTGLIKKNAMRRKQSRLMKAAAKKKAGQS